MIKGKKGILFDNILEYFSYMEAHKADKENINVERDTPKYLNAINNCTEKELLEFTLLCPACGAFISHTQNGDEIKTVEAMKITKYCQECGQSLKWGALEIENDR